MMMIEAPDFKRTQKVSLAIKKNQKFNAVFESMINLPWTIDDLLERIEAYRTVAFNDRQVKKTLDDVASYYPEWNEPLITPLKKIAENANAKRIQLFDILSKDPYISFETRCELYLSRLGLNQAVACLIMLPLFPLLWLADILCCRYFCCRSSEKEKQWVTNALFSHSDLDGPNVDAELEAQIQDLINRVQPKLSQLSLRYEHQVIRKVIKNSDGPDDVYDVDHYFIHISFVVFKSRL